MAKNTANLGFWQLTYDYFKKDVQKPEDDLIVLMHWLLLKNGFQVLGPGSENKIAESEQPSDILPDDWSQNMTSYYMRYTRDKILYLLNGVKAGDNKLIFNFYNVNTKYVSSAAVGNIDLTVHYIHDIVNNKDNFYKTVSFLEKDLIDPMQTENDNKKSTSTQTSESKGTHLNFPFSPQLVPNTPDTDPERVLPRNPYPAYGMPDLNPLGGIRDGGMLYDPMRVRNRNRWILDGVPPLARFDPIRPPNADPMMPGSFRHPNPDHMRPPDFDDNMYM